MLPSSTEWNNKFCLMKNAEVISLTFRRRASSIQDRRFSALQRRLFIYLINNYISLSDICLTCIIGINNIDNQLDATVTAY